MGRTPIVDDTMKSKNIVNGIKANDTGNHQRPQKPDAHVTTRTEKTADTDANSGISKLTASASDKPITINRRLKKYTTTKGAAININFRNLLMLYAYDT
ncbi:hypothetical protein [Methylophaga thalassica]|uniref:hypothetical protein n=1 Tax=Methylophaga aminisulfidivorans TaxID=230105 RepID=UPI00058B5A8A|nr:hypothetical protein [Methylophaga aminisulfidivorans]